MANLGNENILSFMMSFVLKKTFRFSIFSHFPYADANDILTKVQGGAILGHWHALMMGGVRALEEMVTVVSRSNSHRCKQRKWQ